MKFKNQNKSFSIRIIGYEFERAQIKEDLDWLDIEVKACDGDLSWSRRGAFIRTEELEEVQQLLKSKLKHREMEFLENDLSLSMDYNLLHVHLNYDLHPKRNTDSDDSEYVLSFELSEFQLKKSIDDLEKWMKLFPIRARLLR
jgi:hypothetical protein